MANEFKHKNPGSTLTQTEFIASDGTGHIFDSQAAGDVLYASSSTVLARLAKGSDGNILQLASGLPAWTASPTIGSTSWANANHAHAASNSGGTVSANDVSGTTLKSSVVTSSLESLGTLTALQVDYINANASTLTITDSSDTGDLVSLAVTTHGATTLTTTDDDASAADLTLDADGEIVIDAADAAGVILKINGTAQLSVVDGSITPTTNNDIDLGTSSYQFKDGYFDGTLEADAVTIGGTNVVTGSLVTTLGTVSAGTWEGTTVAVAQGGTGATALTNLITLGTHTTGNYAATVANATNGGTTIANSGSESAAITIAVNLDNITVATVNVANDSIVFLDSDGSATRRDSIADLASAMAGTNITASSGTLNASGGGGVPNAFFFA